MNGTKMKKVLVKQAFAINWGLFIAMFLLAEFFGVNQLYIWPVGVFIVWFFVVELWQAVDKSKGGTYSEAARKFIHAGVAWARTAAIWAICAALCTRVAVIQMEHLGYLDPGNLPLVAACAPMWTVLAGVLVWLPPHFMHIPDNGNGASKQEPET